MATASNVAKYILSLTEEESGELVSHLKLQKLLYYCQGFALAINDRPMFEERICAWQHGPVVPDVWQEYRSCGALAIPKPEGFDPAVLTKDERDLVNDVYQTYGQYSAWRLREMTHEEDPWKQTEANQEISQDALQAYFKTRLN